MTRTRIKICGICTPADAEHAISAGADAIGMVFYAQSARHIAISVAREITNRVPPFASTVGLFVNSNYQEVCNVLSEVPLDLLQFHGDEDEEFLKILTVKKYNKIKDYWIILHSQMHNIQKDHTTDMQLENLKVDIGVPDSKFTERMMRRGIK